jgi:Collagen triple helix repeat (20 copies)
MLKALRSRIHLTPGTVIATVALIFAMTGGAYAAKKYLITSTKQISPKVLKALKGAAGRAGNTGAVGATGPAGPQGPAGAASAKGETGPAGAAGVAGKEGAAGKEGSPWTAGGTLPSKKTETGAWSLSATKENAGPPAAISFSIPLASALGEAAVHYVEAEGNGTSCQGTAEEPTATLGNLCVYQAFATGLVLEGEIAKASIQHAGAFPSPAVKGASTSGAVILFTTEEEETPLAYGTWAVTAP